MNKKSIGLFLAVLTFVTTAMPAAKWLEQYPLHDAARRGDAAEIIRLLATRKCDVHVFDTSGGTPLHYAVNKGHVDCVIALLAGGTQVDVTNCSGETSLSNAACRGEVDCMRILLDRGADVGAKSFAGMTPLHYAAGGGFRDGVDMLLQAGADISAKTKMGNTPAMLAEKNKHPELAKYLNEIAESLDIKEPEGE